LASTNREGARGFYDLIVQAPTPQTHAVDWYLRTLSPLVFRLIGTSSGCPSARLSPKPFGKNGRWAGAVDCASAGRAMAQQALARRILC